MGLLLRFAFFGLMAVILYRFLQHTVGLRPPSRESAPEPRRDDANANDANAPVMRRCAHCKVHVPEGESTQSRGQYFCCESHRDAYAREQR